MPQETAPEQPSTSTRRSSRLSNKKDLERKSLSSRQRDEPLTGKRRRSSRKTGAKPYDRNGGGSIAPSAVSNRQAHPRRSLRITPSELVRRENALLAGELDFQERSASLSQRIASHVKQEKETERLMSQIAEREAQATVSQLEEHFLCPLCYEVISAPYTLSSANCGHTFCATCILKWFFSRLHVACGGWHESVDCPICRSLLVMTPDRVPRPDVTFPFIPNRLATTIITSLIEKLSHTPANTAMKVKREEIENTLESGSKGARGRKCNRVDNAKQEEEEKPRSPDVDAWRDEGLLRTEWLKKDKEGKREMTLLFDSWSTLRSHDFISLKQKLGV